MSLPGNVSPSQPSYPTVRPSSPRSVLISIVCAGLAVLCVIGAGVFFALYTGEHRTVADQDSIISDLRQQVSSGTTSDERRAAALRASCDFGKLLVTYDYANLDKYFADVREASTGKWLEEFGDTAGILRNELFSTRSHGGYTEVHCGITSFGTRSTEALVSVGQSVTKVTTGPEPRYSSMTFVATLEEQPDKRWLVSRMSRTL